MSAEIMGRRFWVKTALTSVTAALFAITLVWPDWIELVFGVDPDHGSGWLELLILVVALGLMLTFSLSARDDWRRRPLSDVSR
jgi:hypothetical protein